MLFFGIGAFAKPSLPLYTPQKPANKVISLFSDIYTNVSGTDWFPNCGQFTVAKDIMIVRNTTRKYDHLHYQILSSFTLN